MTVLMYHLYENGVLANSEPAYLDYEETHKQGRDVYACPPNTTLIAPPEYGVNQNVQFDGGQWHIISDYRYALVINHDMEKVVVEDVGDLEEGLILITEEEYRTIQEKPNYYIIVDNKLVKNPNYEQEEFEKAKANKFLENNGKANEVIQNGYVVFKDAQFETNAQTCSDLTATMLMMQTSGIESYDWLSKDDKVVTLYLEEFCTLGGLIATYKNIVWNILYTRYKTQIENAQTLEEVVAIKLDYTINQIYKEM